MMRRGRFASPNTQLVDACKLNRLRRIEELLKLPGIDPLKLKDPKTNGTLLHIAAAGNSENGNQDSIRDPNDNLASDAVPSGIVTALELQGIKIDARDKYGRTALLVASIRGTRAFIEALLTHGADPTLSDRHGRNILHHAAGNSPEVVDFILHCLKYATNLLKQQDKFGRTPLHYFATKANYVPSIFPHIDKATVDLIDSEGKTAMMYAASVPENEDLITHMAATGADMSVRDANNRTVLHYLCGSHRSTSADTLAALLESMTPGELRQTVNIVDNETQTAFHFAAKNGKEALAEVLWQYKAELIVDKAGYTPLHLLMLSGANWCTKLVLEQAPRDKLLYRDQYQRTYLHWFVAQSVAHQWNDSQLMQPLLQIPELLSDEYLCDTYGNTPLHTAAWSGESEYIGILCKALPKAVAKKDQKGRTPLHLACTAGVFDSVRELLRLSEVVANVNAQDVKLRTPLIEAALSGSWKIVQLLLDLKADTTLVDVSGNNVLDAAITNRRQMVLLILVKCGIFPADLVVARIEDHEAGALKGQFEALIAETQGLDVQDLMSKPGFQSTPASDETDDSDMTSEEEYTDESSSESGSMKSFDSVEILSSASSEEDAAQQGSALERWRSMRGADTKSKSDEESSEEESYSEEEDFTAKVEQLLEGIEPVQVPPAPTSDPLPPPKHETLATKPNEDEPDEIIPDVEDTPVVLGQEPISEPKPELEPQPEPEPEPEPVIQTGVRTQKTERGNTSTIAMGLAAGSILLALAGFLWFGRRHK